jgi:hypothetical protein
MKRPLLFLLMLLAFNAFRVSLAYPATEYHGADSVFEKEGIVIFWAILKGQDEASSWVYIKIVNSGGNPYQIYSVEAIDPFSKEKEWVVKGVKLEKENLIWSIQTFFRDKTARRILFYRSKETLEKETPDMTVFYLSVPDTSPEFLLVREIEYYFNKALERLNKFEDHKSTTGQNPVG